MIRRTWALGLSACALAGAGVALAQRAAEAAAPPIVVQRFLLGHMDRAGRFIATAGRGATNVERNAIAMFVFSGPVASGPNLRATLPLTLAEQAALDAKIKEDPDYDPTRDGYEPGVIPRRRSEERDALYVATGSVNQFTVRVQTGAESAPGTLFKYVRPGRNPRPVPNVVLFNPRYAGATFNKPGEVDYNAEAFSANTDYSVVLFGGPNVPSGTSVTNTSGVPLAQQFTTTFRTTARYVQDYSRPEFRAASPSDGTLNVPYDSDIDLVFSEPMDVSSFVLPRFQGDDVYTLAVRYTSDPQINGALSGRNVLGTVRIKPQTAGRVVQFRPIQGFGKGPYRVEAVVTNGVTDLSGNNIIRQFQFGFTTESNPDADEFNEILESFDTGNPTSTPPVMPTKYETNTANFTPSGDFFWASWNGLVPAGSGSPTGARNVLTTTVVEKTFDVNGPNAPTAAGTGINVWYHAPINVQMLFPSAAMGSRARTINGFSWIRGVWRGRTYPNTSVYLGHANDEVNTAGFTTAPSFGNFGDIPVQVVPPTSYRTINLNPGASIYVRGPDFLKTFDYDGQRGLILDLLHNGDPASQQTIPGGPDLYERWRYDAVYPITTSTVAFPGTATHQQNKWLYSTQFRYLTPGAEVQSTFYDIGRGNARLLPQQIVPTTQPVGTAVVFQWQGARGDLTNPAAPDMSTLTNWVSDIRQLANYQHIRFRVTLFGNTVTRAVPSVDLLTIPYVYRN